MNNRKLVIIFEGVLRNFSMIKLMKQWERRVDRETERS